MKFVILIYIALGFVLSVFIGVEYNFKGQEMMPKYWGSPFVYKQESFGSSLECYYSVYGLFLNVVIWSIVLFFMDKGIRRINWIKKRNVFYNGIIAFLLIFSSLNVLFHSLLIGSGFEKT